MLQRIASKRTPQRFQVGFHVTEQRREQLDNLADTFDLPFVKIFELGMDLLQEAVDQDQAGRVADR